MRVLVGLVVALFMANGALAQDASFVVIYRTQAPYSNIVRLPADARESMKPYVKPGRVELIDWSAFKSNAQRYLAPSVLKNEYPASNLAKLVVALLEGYPGIPIGVTWTGGIAISNDERTYAEKIYRLFRENPEEYERTKVSGDQALDPIHPQHRLGPTLVVVPKPEGPWWKCQWGSDDRPPRTPDQQRRLENFALGIFFPELPGYGLQGSGFTRSDLIKRFGQPLSTKSKEGLPYDPSDPMEVVTTWEYRGFSITTVASKPNPEALWVDKGEIFDAKMPLRYGVRIGQSVEQWADQFGRPICNTGVPPFSQPHLVYDGQYYFACGKNKSVSCVATYEVDLYLDDSGMVLRMIWSHPML